MDLDYQTYDSHPYPYLKWSSTNFVDDLNQGVESFFSTSITNRYSVIFVCSVWGSTLRLRQSGSADGRITEIDRKVHRQ